MDTRAGTNGDVADGYYINRLLIIGMGYIWTS